MLSRIWTLLLALALAGAVAGVFLVTIELNRRAEHQTKELLVHDWREVEQALAIEAHRRVDAIAGIAVNSDVRAALAAASKDRTVDHAALEHALRTLNSQLQEGAADRLIAVRADGRIVADVGGRGVPPARAGMGAFPVVRDALRGYLADDVIVYDGAVLRVAARPVVDEGQYVGAVVHGKRLDAHLAEQLQKVVPGTSVGLYRGAELLGMEVPSDVHGAPDASAVSVALAKRVDEHDASSARHSKPLELEGKGWAVTAPVTGSAGHAGVGVVVARPAPKVASPVALLSVVTRDELREVPWLVVGAVAFLVVLLGWVFYALDVKGPRTRFARAVEALAADDRARLQIADVPGPYRSTAERINAALDAAAGRAVAVGGRGDELREILEAPQEPEKRASYFAFASEPPAATEEATAAATGAVPPPAAPPRDTYADAPALSLEDTSRVSETPELEPDELEEDEDTSMPDESGTDEDTLESANVPQPASPAAFLTPPAPKPAAPMPPAAVPPAPSVPAFDPDGFDDDGATTVAEIPRELIAAVQEKQARSMDPETAHFHEVYDQFVEMKKRLGEPTAGLTYERFEVTLKKNRDTIVEKHGVSTVRFTVYDKGGKAALRATPVK
jgi:hypothetical protein